MAQTETLDYLIRFIVRQEGTVDAGRIAQGLETSAKKLGITAANLNRVLAVQTRQVQVNAQGTKQASKAYQDVTAVYSTLDGQVKTLTQTFDRHGNEVKKVEASHVKAAVSTSHLAANMARLALRAALVIPIWQTIRLVFTSTVGTFNDTVKSLADIEKALQFTRNEFTVFDGDVTKALVNVKEKAEELALTFGTSVAENIETFRIFKTAGLEVEDSMAGMEAAIKGAVISQESAADLAKVLADVYNLMGDSITEVHGPTEKMNFILSSMVALMPTNVFTIREFADALKNVTGTAGAAGLTLDQLFTLVAVSATTMERGARGGTRLAQSLRLVTQHIGEVSKFLDRDVNLENEDLFTVFFDVLQKADNLIKSGQNRGFLIEELTEIFGARGGSLAAGLGVNFDKLRTELENLQKLTPEERGIFVQERLDNAAATMALQVKRMKELREEIGRTFIQGLTGTESFADALKAINTQLERMIPIAEQLGKSFRDLLQITAIIAASRIGLGALGSVSRAGRAAGISAAVAKAASDRPIVNAATGAVKILGQPDVVAGAWAATFVAKITKDLAAAVKKIPILGTLLSGPGALVLAGLAATRSVDILTKDNALVGSKFLQDLRVPFNPFTSKEAKEALINKDINRIAFENELEIINLRRKAQGLPSILPEEEKPVPEGRVKLGKDLFVEEAELVKLLERAKTLGFNELEILQLQLKATKDKKEQERLRLEIIQQINQEIISSSEELRKSFESSLSGLLQTDIGLNEFVNNISKTITGGLFDSISGNLTDQIFKATGIGELFGSIGFDIRHSGDTVGEQIRIEFDRGAEVTGDVLRETFRDSAILLNTAIRSGFRDSVNETISKVNSQSATEDLGFSNTENFNPAVSSVTTGINRVAEVLDDGTDDVGTSLNNGANRIKRGVDNLASALEGFDKKTDKATFGNVPGALGNLANRTGFSGLTLPGFGPGGFFTKRTGGQELSPTEIENIVSGISQLRPTRGQIAGAGAFTALTAFQQFQSAGGRQGNLSIPSGLFGGAGAAALGLHQLGFAGSGTAAGGAGALAGSSLLPVVGIALLIGSAIFSAFSKTRERSVEERTTESRVASKIDITNKQLEIVNRNLLAIDNSLQDVFTLPESTFFRERLSIEDGFSISSRRGL